MAPKLLLLDVDGVLEDFDGCTAIGVYETLAALKFAGLRLGLLTQRPYGFCKHLLHRIDWDFLSTSGGALSEYRGEGVEVHTIVPLNIRELTQRLETFSSCYRIVLSCGKMVYANGRAREHYGNRFECVPIEGTENGGASVNSIIIKGLEPLHARTIASLLKSHGCVESKMRPNETTTLTVRPFGISKKTGLNCAIRSFKLIPSEVAFMGDDVPDLPVIANVGYSACPSNSHKAVLTHARFRTKASHSHGLLEFLERINRELIPSLNGGPGRTLCH